MTDSSSRDDTLLSLLLFACSSALWLVLNDKCSRSENDNASMLPPFNRHPSRIKSNRKNAVGGGPSRRNINSSTTSDDDDDNDDANKKSFNNGHHKKRKTSKEERNFLMEKISLSDSVLTRETSLDFHPKNSNWSHFENYAPPPSPQRKGTRIPAVDETDEENEEEDFLWSDPPSLHRRGDSIDAHILQYTDNSLQDRKAKYCRRDSSVDILHFNANCLPGKLILIRHGQSEGNVDESLYATKPDNAMGLTKLGWDMARMAGKALREELPPDETVHFIVSPYARTVETFHGLVSAWSDPEDFAHIPPNNRSKRLKSWYTKLMEMGLTWHEDPRIREQDFGNYQDPQVIKKAKSERHKFGSFYYRFPHGESASDVFDRVSTFLDSLWRSFESGRAQNYVLVAHGITIRVFLARYFRYSIDQFHMLANPRNCESVILGHDGLGRLKLVGRCELDLEEYSLGETSNSDKEGGADGKVDSAEKKKSTITLVTGYRKHSRLRTLPPQWVRHRTVRMCYSDSVG